MVLLAAGGESLWGPIDVTPLLLVGLLAAGAVLVPAVAVVARAVGAKWSVAWRWGGGAGLACVGVAAGWCLIWLRSNEHFRSQLDIESVSFLALLFAVCGACGWCAVRLFAPGFGKRAWPSRVRPPAERADTRGTGHGWRDRLS